MVKSNVVHARFDKGQQVDEAFLDRLAAELEREPPVVSEGFYRDVEKDFMEDTYRRFALMYLAQPWADTSDVIRTSRKAAIAAAKIAENLNDSITFARSLESILTAAQYRIWLALSRREDAEGLIAEVKQALAAESTGPALPPRA